MRKRIDKRFWVWLLLWLVLVPTVKAFAGQPAFNQIVFFGDSLSDNGNLFRIADGMLPKSPPYFQGRFSNGFVWSEIVAKQYLNKYNVKSKNYAIGGETVLPQDFPPFTLTQSISDYLLENFLEDKSQPYLLFGSVPMII